jgi:putative colanic acid biosynthesis acetyltransferase WcaF
VSIPPRTRIHVLRQENAFASPWPVGTRLRLAIWGFVRVMLFRPTPKPLTRWRVFLLRLFGATVRGQPFVSESAIVKMPWLLTLEDRACLGPNSEVYNLGRVTLGPRCTVSQQAYLCGGTHDFRNPTFPLVVGDIVIGADVFVGARAFILPGVTVGDGAVIGACAVVTKDVAPWTVVAGNPARVVSLRDNPSRPPTNEG